MMTQTFNKSEIDIINKEINTAKEKHKRNISSQLKGVGIVILILCILTMIGSDIKNIYILPIWLTIGLVYGFWFWFESYSKTKKYIKPFINALATNSRKDVEQFLSISTLKNKNITPKTIIDIEKKLNIILPQFYKNTLLKYPFPLDSLVDDCLLPNDPVQILKNNDTLMKEIINNPEINPFFVGSDGGEELYFIDLNSQKSTVFVHSLESKESNLYVNDWSDFLNDIEKSLLEIEEDEKKNA